MDRRVAIGFLMFALFGMGRLAGQDSAARVNTTGSQPTAQIPGTEPGESTARPAGDPVLKPNPIQTLRDFEPAEDEVYRLGRGDEITVDFPGRPEMQAKLVVGPDGRITLPLAGDVMLAGLTRPEAAKAIGAALAAYYANLEAQVTVTKYTANRILLLGAVEHPGIMTFDGTPTLLEVLTRGGLTAGRQRLEKFPSVALSIAATTRWFGWN